MAKPGRIFVPLDVNWYDEWGHEVSDDAALLWVLAICACKRMVKDGRLTVSQVRRVAQRGLLETTERFEKALAELRDNPNAPVHDDGTGAVEMDGWSEWNDLAAEIEAMSEGGEFGNHLRWHVKRKRPKTECQFCYPSSGPIAPDIAPDSGPESKSRVDQTRVDAEKSYLERDASVPASEQQPPKRQQRRSPQSPVPDAFPLDDGLREWAVANGLESIDLEAETAAFLDWHGAKGSLMADWRKAWFTWMRKARPSQARQAPARRAPAERSRDLIDERFAAIRRSQESSTQPQLEARA